MNSKNILIFVIEAISCILFLFFIKIGFGITTLYILDDYYDLILDQQVLNKEKLIKKFGNFWVIVVVIVGSTLEEFVFRGCLSKTKKGLLFSGAGFLIYSISIFLEQIGIDGTFKIVVLLVGILISFALILQQPNKQISFFNIPTFALIIISSLLFAAIHLTNYTEIKLEYNQMIYVVMPHFVTGLAYCWIRIKYSLFHSITTHTLSNLLVVLSW